MKTVESSSQSRDMSRLAQKQKLGMGDVEPGQKPKKVNSEIRKQQNRIASRNYREKRKQKLQYLQQLLRDDGDETEQHEGILPEGSHDGRERSYSAEYRAERSISSSEMLPSNRGFSPLPSHSRSTIEAASVPPSTYDQYLPSPSRPFPLLESNWNTPMYEPHPQVRGHVSSWNLPHWMSTLDYTPQMSIRADDFQYATQHTSQQVYQQLPTPPQQTMEHVPNADLFMLGNFTNGKSHHDQRARKNVNTMTRTQSYNAHRCAAWI